MQQQPASRSIFRKVALERLSTPEQLDQLMQVTTPRGWIALASIALLLLVAIIWSFTARLPVEVGGQGMLLRGGRVYQVLSTVAGQVADLSLRPGDEVSAGQVVAQIVPIATGEGAPASPVAVTSLFGGRVVEVAVTKGGIAAAGSTIALLEDTSQPLEAVVFVPAGDAGQLRPGTEGRIVPVGGDRTAAPLPGRVSSVGQFPASRDAMLGALGNDALLDQFANAGPLVEVHVALNAGSTTLPPGGTLCAVSLKVGERRPISLVLPILD